MNSINEQAKRKRRALALSALALASLVAACDTQSLLEVDLPGNVTAEDVELPGLAPTVRVAAIGGFEYAWDTYLEWARRHSDEYIQSSGNFSTKRGLLRDIPPEYGTYQSDLFGRMHTARVLLENHFDRLQGFTVAQVPARAQFLAEMRTYGGFLYVAFGETFCGNTLNGEERVYTSKQMLEIAVTQLTEAMELAQAANRPNLLNAARVGRARAYLGLERYADAIADAEKVPAGFLFVATREAGHARRVNQHDAINRLETNRSATVAPRYRDVTWKGVKDRRVNAINTGFVGHDNSTIVWRHDKMPAQGGEGVDAMVASHREAQMFIAEAAALTGDLARARTILNDFHTKAGIPPVTEADIPTQADVIRHVIEERRREFFVEGAHRLRDHLRWRGTAFNIPMKGEPGSDHPNGVDQYGQPYGRTTCFPIAQNEMVSGG